MKDGGVLLIGSVNRIIEALLVVGAESGGEMCTGREAEHADALRIDVPLRSVRADHADSSLGVLKRGVRLWEGPRVRNPVFQQNAGDCFFAQPVANLSAFQIDGKNVVAASGENDDRGAGVLAFPVDTPSAWAVRRCRAESAAYRRSDCLWRWWCQLPSWCCRAHRVLFRARH